MYLLQTHYIFKSPHPHITCAFICFNGWGRLSCRSGEPLIVTSFVPEVLFWVGLVFLLNKKSCLLVESADTSFLVSRQACLLVRQEDLSSCSARRHIFMLSKTTPPLVRQEAMPSRSKRRRIFSSNKKTCLLAEQEDCLLIEQEDVSSLDAFPRSPVVE